MSIASNREVFKEQKTIITNGSNLTDDECDIRR